MNAGIESTERRPLLPLLILHAVAAGACFAFFATVPIAVCLVLMAIGNDPGGPLFFSMFVFGMLLFAAAVTAFLEGATILSEWLRRRHSLPLYWPPLVVFVAATALLWPLAGRVHPMLGPTGGAALTLAFIVHWAAVSTLWFLPRWLFRIFR